MMTSLRQNILITGHLWSQCYGALVIYTSSCKHRVADYLKRHINEQLGQRVSGTIIWKKAIYSQHYISWIELRNTYIFKISLYLNFMLKNEHCYVRRVRINSPWANGGSPCPDPSPPPPWSSVSGAIFILFRELIRNHIRDVTRQKKNRDSLLIVSLGFFW